METMEIKQQNLYAVESICISGHNSQAIRSPICEMNLQLNDPILCHNLNDLDTMNLPSSAIDDSDNANRNISCFLV